MNYVHWPLARAARQAKSKNCVREPCSLLHRGLGLCTQAGSLTVPSYSWDSHCLLLSLNLTQKLDLTRLTLLPPKELEEEKVSFKDGAE